MVFALLKPMYRVDCMFCHHMGTGKGFCLDDMLSLSVSITNAIGYF